MCDTCSLPFAHGQILRTFSCFVVSDTAADTGLQRPFDTPCSLPLDVYSEEGLLGPVLVLSLIFGGAPRPFHGAWTGFQPRHTFASTRRSNRRQVPSHCVFIRTSLASDADEPLSVSPLAMRVSSLENCSLLPIFNRGRFVCHRVLRVLYML